MKELDDAVARSLGFIYCPDYFRPSTNWAVLGPLLDNHLSEITHDGDKWNALCFRGYGDNIRYGSGSDPENKMYAICRAIIDSETKPL